jgi:hypothetical protein
MWACETIVEMNGREHTGATAAAEEEEDAFEVALAHVRAMYQSAAAYSFQANGLLGCASLPRIWSCVSEANGTVVVEFQEVSPKSLASAPGTLYMPQSESGVPT